jgi:chitinase
MKNFCYFTNWSPTLANFDARFDVRDINATLCSHLIYAFANIDTTELKLVRSQTADDNGSLTNKQGRYFEFNKLKIKNPELVTLLSIGGANGKGFYQIVANEASMATFARNVAIYLRDRDFDGIDIDWEWPMEIYRNKFTTMLQVMCLALNFVAWSINLLELRLQQTFKLTCTFSLSQFNCDRCLFCTQSTPKAHLCSLVREVTQFPYLVY